MEVRPRGFGYSIRYSKVGATTMEAMKKNPGCLGYIGDNELPSYVIIYTITYHEVPY